MTRLKTNWLAMVLAGATFAGCATAGTPAPKGDEDEVAASNEKAPKPPSSSEIQAQQA